MKSFFKMIVVLLLLLPLTAKAFVPLPAEQAFVLSAQFKTPTQLQMHLQIAPLYHLYRERFVFKLLDEKDLKIAPVELPPGIFKEDEILGKYQVYANSVDLFLNLKNQPQGQYTLQVDYQGCADSGFCYPPVTQYILLTLSPAGNKAQIAAAREKTLKIPQASPAQSPDKITTLLTQSPPFFILLGFLGFGLMLAFTPCVLPMLPILSSIIVGQGAKRSTTRSFYLALTYVLAIALTYAVAGAVAALAGSYVQAFLQNPWVICFFSLFLVLLALAQLGIYRLRLPARWNHRLTELSQRQKGGSYLGVFIMGSLSVLIVSPCISAPLIGVITYLSTTGDVYLGGAALFMLGLGMGIPLLLIGTFAGKYLPKAGAWLEGMKVVFGVMLLALAIWLLQRIISGQSAMLLWAAFLIILAVYLFAINKGNFKQLSMGSHGVGTLSLLYGSALFFGALQGNTDPLQPLGQNQAAALKTSSHFTTVTSLPALQSLLAQAKAQAKPVLIDVYADWCISCKIMERAVLQQPQVQARLAPYVLIRVDITANGAAEKAVMQYLKVLAPPTFIFYNASSAEISTARIFGEVSAEQFLQRIPLA